MLSRVGEGKLRGVRMLLVVAWVVLIASLFWDPVTPELTKPDNLASPFHLQGKQVVVQGQVLPEDPYAMSNRIWWTMIIPILPLFFLVAGHETWRRLCPLSFVSQIPRYLGWQRKRPVLDRRSGKVSRLLALPARDGWARRNVWYIQFGLLWLALNARILFINSDRLALAGFMIGVIVVALFIGYMWGGKAWCNYVCPIAVVQKIYTQPRGLLESEAHTARIPITQSMCRAPGGKDGDKSICVGCTPSCPDIDIEKSHWDSLLDKPRRNVYYLFFGLVLGFYCFYYLYSGTWDYYFSGAWTHERSQVATLFAPGLVLFGTVIPIPKILSAPLILGVFCAGAWLLGVALEHGYRWLRNRIGKPLAEPELMNHCLLFSAYVTINTFYLFGGRPNLSLLPTPALKAVDIAIVALTTLWFWQGIQRTPLRYRRESLATSLLEQLRSLKVDLTRFLEGRKLEELKPDEVYVLAKTMPAFSHDQKLSAYRNILEDALQQGRTNSAASLEMLREVRNGLGVNDDEHRAMLADLGVDAAGETLDPDQAASYENWIRIGNYKRAVEMALLGPMESGQPLAAALSRPEVQKAIAESRELLRITQEEHDAVVSQVTGHGGMLFERARALLEPIARMASLRMGLAGLMPRDEDCVALARLIGKVLRQRLVALCAREFSVMLTLGDSPESLWLARNLANVLGSDLEVALDEPVAPGGKVTWEESLGAEVVVALRGARALEPAQSSALPPMLPFRKVIDDSLDLEGNLAILATDADPRLQALAVTALSYLDLGRARQVANEIAQARGEPHWLLVETLESVLGESRARSSETRRYGAITLTVASPNAPTRNYSIDKPYVTIGRDPSNDVVISHPSVAPFHFALSHGASGVELRRADPMVRATVDGTPMGAQPLALHSGARVGLREDSGGPTFVASWDEREKGGFTPQTQDTLTRMIWLSQVRVFENLDLESLADLAETAEVRLYDQGTWLCREGEPSSDAFMLQSGALEVSNAGARLDELGPGSIVGEIGVLTQRPRAASVCVSSTVARVVTLDGARLRRLLASNASVAAGMLVGVAHYVALPRARNRNSEVQEAA